jgi:hypothetical protein
MRVMSGVLLAILLTCPRMSGAQTTTAPPGEVSVPPRAFLDVNLIGATKSASGAREFRSRFITFGEAGSARAIYPKPSNITLLPALDVGAGYITGSLLGLGINISRASFEDGAHLGTTIPHPVVLNAPGSTEGDTNRELTRNETAISAFVTAVPLRTSRAELRFFGGPTYFLVNAEMVQSVTYSQSSSVTPLTNTITVTGFTTEDAKGRGLGFHLGTDFTYFFTKMIGVRGGLRYNHAHVTVKHEPLSKLDQKLKVGGPLLFLGARFRFGR